MPATNQKAPASPRQPVSSPPTLPEQGTGPRPQSTSPVRTRTRAASRDLGMRLVCCYVHLHPETERVMRELGAELRWTGDDDYHYFRVFRELYQEGRPWLHVEQDLVPTRAQLEELVSCPHEVCTVRYSYPCADLTDYVTTGLGLIKLGRPGGQLPAIDWSHRWSVLPEGEFWHWNDIVTYLFGQLPDRHLHPDLMVEHHHDCASAHPRRLNPNSAP